jgi:peptidoglycan/LPS O-acetylase OafA/YrhL
MLNQNRVEAAGGHYRPDIDGLRAVAVLPVVFYHFNVWPFRGGFVGVDVFFVISGYLITSLIWSEMQAGSFSVLNFYERRIRRIFPALFAMMAGVAIASAVILFPHELERFAISLLATAGFVSNFHFWGESGYWAVDAAEKPLLHTWSLAVEEQFYLFFPGFLYLLRRQSAPRVLWVLGGTLAVSLALSIVGAYRAPISTFYLLPTRFWELLIGGVLAVGRFQAPQNSALRNALAVLGLALIAWSVFTLTSASPFPGANAIPPCLGTALIIFAGSGRTTAVNSTLAMRVLVFVGLISYSLYLWHWPIYVLLNQVRPDGLTAIETALGIAAAFVLAVLSWRYVEQPFRGRRSAIRRKPLFVLSGGAVAAAALVAAGLAAAKGLPQRYDPITRKILAEVDDQEPLRGHCFDRSAAKIAKVGLCKFGATTAKPTFVLWGDSHADAMTPALWKLAASHGEAGLLGAHGHCAPLLGVPLSDPACQPFNQAVAKIALGKKIRTVFLDALWTAAAGEPPVDAKAGEQADIAKRDQFARGLMATVATLKAAGKTVVIIGPVTVFKRSVPEDLARIRVWHGNPDIAPTRTAFLAREAFVYAVFHNVAARYGVTVVWLDNALCPGTRCLTLVNGRPIYQDKSHLSVFGAERLTPLFRGLI